MKTISGRSVIFNGPGNPFQHMCGSVRDLQEGEILVKNRYTTICGSDLHTYSGLRKEVCPTILGHEVVAEVVEIHSSHSAKDHHGSPLAIGDLVTWAIFCSAPDSYNAARGIPQKGDQLFKYGHALVDEEHMFHGGLSEYCILKRNTCIIKLTAEIPLKVASIINCAVSTVAGALRHAGDLKGKRVLIFGMGTLGVTCAAMSKHSGAAWVGAADINEGRMQNALSFGADEAVDLTQDATSLIKSMKERWQNKGIDVVFDMNGSPEAMELGISMLTIGGTAVWAGAVFNARNVHIDAEFVVRNLITIKGIHNYNYDDFSNAVEFIRQNWNRYPFDTVVEKEFSLTEVQEAFDYAITKRPLRVGITMESIYNNHPE